VPMLLQWPAKVKAGTVSNALFSQIDLFASFGAMTGRKIKTQDSYNNLNTLLGAPKSRDFIVQQSVNSTLSIIQGNWKYIEPSNGPRRNEMTNTELGNDPKPQLYNLKEDKNEQNNLAERYPKQLKMLSDKLKALRAM